MKTQSGRVHVSFHELDIDMMREYFDLLDIVNMASTCTSLKDQLLKNSSTIYTVTNSMRWIVHIDHETPEHLKSKPFRYGGYDWCIIVFPRGNSLHNYSSGKKEKKGLHHTGFAVYITRCSKQSINDSQPSTIDVQFEWWSHQIQYNHACSPYTKSFSFEQ